MKESHGEGNEWRRHGELSDSNANLTLGKQKGAGGRGELPSCLDGLAKPQGSP